MYFYFDMFIELENVIYKFSQKVVILKFTITFTCTLYNRERGNKSQLHYVRAKVMM